MGEGLNTQKAPLFTPPAAAALELDYRTIFSANRLACRSFFFKTVLIERSYEYHLLDVENRVKITPSPYAVLASVCVSSLSFRVTR